jgi:hypothetical protein
MKVWKVSPAASAPADDLSALMAELDALPTEKRSATPKKPTAKAEPVAPAFVQQWFPRAIICHGTEQHCQCCGQTWESITGLFLEDQHRNGALRQQRVQANVVPPEYFGLPTRQDWAEEEVPYCAICFQTEFRTPEPALPLDLIRELSQDDLNSLKEDAQ